LINHLEGKFFKTFVTVLEEKSFSRAADKLGYVQSTVTTQMQLLEQVCNQKLFHRLSRGVKPTEAGLKFAKYAYRFIQLGMSLEETMNESNAPQGKIQVRMQESFFVTRLASPFQQFLTKYPMIKILPETGFQQDILQKVLDHSVDYGFVPRNPERKEIIFYPLVEETLIFAASKDMAEKVELEGAAALQREILICFGATCLYQTHAIKLLQEYGVQEINAIELPSIDMIKETLQCGMGYALLPRISVEKELAEDKFEILSFCQPITIDHGLIHHRDRELSHPSKLFRDYILEFFKTKAVEIY
jgi:DNA-binding transcriptional LysR family regulator